MLRRNLASLVMGVAFTIAGGMSSQAQAEELTILWAEWDPANYLQELVNLYTAETGVTVTVQTTPWPDFQTKAFAEFNAKGDAFDMVVGDSPWLGAGSTGGHYVELTDFFAKHKVDRAHGPGDPEILCRIPQHGKYWSIPLEGDAAGWAYRKDWFEDPKEMEAFKAKYGYDLDVPKTYTAAARHRRVLLSSRPEALRHRHLYRQRLRRDADGCGRPIFSYGGELGDYATYKVDGILNHRRT